MEVPGVYNGTIILRDRETRTLWAPFSGKALEGPLAGKRLERIPLSLTRWKDWKARHPATGVLWGPEQARGGHGSWYEPGKWGIVAEMGATLQGWDTRLPENALVYGVEIREDSKSYPLAEVQARRVVNDQVGDVPLVVAAVGELEVAAFDRRLGGRLLTFSPAPDRAGADAATARRGASGLARARRSSGPLRGQRLTAIEGYVVEWHVWAAYNPRTGILGGAVPAEPVVEMGMAFPALRLMPVDKVVAEPVLLTGEVNVVALWASWCPPCRLEMPELQALSRAHSSRGLRVQGIAMHMPGDDAERKEVRRFLSEAGVTFPNHLVDERAYDQLEALARSLGRPGLVLPTVFVVDKRGRLRAVFSGSQVAHLPAALKEFFRVSSAGPAR